MEGALGMSYAGKRALVCMKHVGLNVAADAFINSAITGANGGLVVVAADDPAMHSSQNEQDSRFYGKFAQIPILEPTEQQEAYEMVHYGFELSEKYKVPVLLRITTRLAHSRAGVVRNQQQKPQNKLALPSRLNQFVLLPAIARGNYRVLIDNQKFFKEESLTSGFNKYIDGKDKSMGIIACGIAINYVTENYLDQEIPYPVLKINQYPVHKSLIEKIYQSCDSILVLEDGYPIIEEQLRGFLDNGKPIKGRMDETIRFDGELNPIKVGVALGFPEPPMREIPSLVVARPPALCPGCPHIDSFKAINAVLEEQYSKGRVFSDIGCYTLGALPPYDAINTCVDMGASITMAKGAADAGLTPAIAVIGDSTFTHSGITGLIDAVKDKSNITVFILDNDTTAMTGGQDSSAVGARLDEIVRGIGVEPEHIHVIRPLKKFHEENMELIRQELKYEGVSVIIPRRECVVVLDQRIRTRYKDK
jgi:indolepyruvate ferredoxin oxidoreductase, alpha subunit